MQLFTKTDLVDHVAEALTMPKSRVAAVIDTALASIILAAAQDSGYRISGFGTFRGKTTAARTGRNPRTGDPVAIPARMSLAFKPAKAGKVVL